MGFVSSLLGLGGGNGANFQAAAAPVLQPTTANQANEAYNEAQRAIQRQNDLVTLLGSAGGLENQRGVFTQQQQLANQLQQQAGGAGPNPALAQLANTTGQNVAQQAALLASQRGASANPGLMSRIIAQQGAATQQQSAGQAAALQAQQQLAAQQQLQQQQQMLAGLSTQQVGQQLGAQQQAGQNAFNEQQMLLNAIQGQNQANISNVSQANSANAGVAQQNARTQGGILSGLAGAAGTALMGPIGSLFGGSSAPAQGLGAGNVGSNPSAYAFAHGGQIKSKMGQHFYSKGAMVPGRAEKAGDSYSNDKVPAMLSPGEIVLPRSVTQHPDAANKAAAFVQAILSKGKK